MGAIVSRMHRAVDGLGSPAKGPGRAGQGLSQCTSSAKTCVPEPTHWLHCSMDMGYIRLRKDQVHPDSRRTASGRFHNLQASSQCFQPGQLRAYRSSAEVRSAGGWRDVNRRTQQDRVASLRPANSRPLGQRWDGAAVAAKAEAMPKRGVF